MRRAKWTASEPAARTAASRASGEAGARGSMITIGRESASEISLRSNRPAPRAKDCQWMRDAGEPSRQGRRPSISVSAAASRDARACAGVASPPPAVTLTGKIRGSTSTSSVAGPVITRWARPNGSRRTRAGGGSWRRPRRPNVTSIRTRAWRRPAGRRSGSGSSGSSIQPGGSGSRPALASSLTCNGCSSITDRTPISRESCAPIDPAPIHASAPAPSSSSAAPVTYSGSASNVPATTSSSAPSAAQPSAERISAPAREGRGRRGGRGGRRAAGRADARPGRRVSSRPPTPRP